MRSPPGFFSASPTSILDISPYWQFSTLSLLQPSMSFVNYAISLLARIVPLRCYTRLYLLAFSTVFLNYNKFNSVSHHYLLTIPETSYLYKLRSCRIDFFRKVGECHHTRYNTARNVDAHWDYALSSNKPMYNQSSTLVALTPPCIFSLNALNKLL